MLSNTTYGVGVAMRRTVVLEGAVSQKVMAKRWGGDEVRDALGDLVFHLKTAIARAKFSSALVPRVLPE